MRDEYGLLAEVLRRGSLGLRFPMLATHLKDAWRSAASVNARYSIVGELSGGFGYPLGLNYPSRPFGLVWNLPLVSRVRTPEYARELAEKVSNYSGIVMIEAYTEDAVLTLLKSLRDLMVELDTPLELLKRWEQVKWVTGEFVYDRRFLNMRIKSPEPIDDLGLRIIHPSGRHKVIRVSIPRGKEKEMSVEVV